MQLQLRKINTVLTICLFCIFTLCYGQEEKYVFKIYAYKSEGGLPNKSTGFLYKKNGKTQGIFTTLHGVCGYKRIEAYYSNGTLLSASLNISAVDISRDVALLTYSQLYSTFSTEGLDLSNYADLCYSLKDKEAKIYGYPFGRNTISGRSKVAFNVPCTDILENIIENDEKTNRIFRDRGSPKLNREMLLVLTEISPGESGSPIIVDNRVVGIADGAIGEGYPNTSWAIPTTNIELELHNPNNPAYINVIKSNANGLFFRSISNNSNRPRTYKDTIIYPTVPSIYNTTEESGIPFSVSDPGDGKADVQFLGVMKFYVENSKLMLYYDAKTTGTNGNVWQKSIMHYGPVVVYTPEDYVQIVGITDGNFDNGKSYRYEFGINSDGYKMPYTPIKEGEKKRIMYNGFHTLVGNFFIKHIGNTEGSIWGSFFDNSIYKFCGVKVRIYGYD